MRNHVIVAHGKSEVDLFRGLFARLGHDAIIYCRDGGRGNIAMSHLPAILSSNPFTSEDDLHKRFPLLDYRGDRNPRIPVLTIFPVMDYDGDNLNVVPYITGNLLKGVPMADKVAPVLNYPNLDAVMESLGYGVVDVRRKDDYYLDLVARIRRREHLTDLYGRLRDCDETNMDILLYHMMSVHPSFQDAIDEPRRKTWSCIRGSDVVVVQQ